MAVVNVVVDDDDGGGGDDGDDDYGLWMMLLFCRTSTLE